jgi:ribosomal protein L11 methyltransferase
MRAILSYGTFFHDGSAYFYLHPMKYSEYIYLLPSQLEYEVQEMMAIREFNDFFIESIKGKEPVLRLFLAKAPDVDESVLEDLSSLSLELLDSRDVEELDWLKAWMDTLSPFELTEGVWVNPFPDRAFEGPNGALVLKVVPGTAFGTGLHSTTRLAAKVMDQMDLKGKSVVDVGSGTGILALLARFRGAEDLLCLDDDPAAAEKAHITFRDNGLGQVDSRVSDLLDNVDQDKRYDIVVANIICEVLELLLDHPRLNKICHAETELVFSGISEEKRPRMEKAIERHRVVVLEHHQEGDWNSYRLKLPS